MRMMKPATQIRVLLVLASAAAAGCGRPTAETIGVEVEFSAPAWSGEPNLYAASGGRVILTWLEPLDGERHALKVAVRNEAGWSEPRTIVESDHFFVNWADFPSLIELPDGSWVVHWLEKVAEATYAYHVKLAISDDRGATWSEPIVPHIDLSPKEHGFVAMTPWHDDAALVWLDGQGMKDAGGEGEGLDRGNMGFHATTISSDGTLGEDISLDDRVCECCQTSLVRTESGLLAAYRDRSESEVRNISVARFVDGEWSEPKYVADDGWQFPGCPVNGPQLSATGDLTVVAWFTAPDRVPAVYAAFSTDGGATFGARIRVDDGDPLGRVDTELLEDGTAVVSWLERTAEAAEVRARSVRASGELGDSRVVTLTSESRGSGFPRMVRAGEELVFAWTLTGEAGGVRVGTLPLAVISDQ